MKLEINELYHRYIIKIVVFAVFTFKCQLRQPNVFKQSVQIFVKKRLPWVIELKIDTGIKLNIEDERDKILDSLLNDSELDIFKMVSVTFISPLRTVRINIDTNREKDYEKFLYS